MRPDGQSTIVEILQKTKQNKNCQPVLDLFLKQIHRDEGKQKHFLHLKLKFHEMRVSEHLLLQTKCSAKVDFVVFYERHKTGNIWKETKVLSCRLFEGMLPEW